ncbi:MAG: hypothetical protein ACR2F6_07440, partial [Mycobacteriales bacterium]
MTRRRPRPIRRCRTWCPSGPVAGLGNIFQADDGFGVAVAAALHDVPMPDGVEVRDFGIRGIH